MQYLKAIVRQLLLMPGRAVLRFAGVSTGRRVRVYGKLTVHRCPGSRIVLGDGLVLNSKVSKNTLEARGPNILKTIRRDARLLIGSDSGMTSATVSCAHFVSIGSRVLIGAGVLITDSDHHVVVPPDGAMSRRFLGLPAAKESDRVLIGDDVFIGSRSIILKGSNIGTGSVIGAGSVVAGEIPPMVIAGGNPCRVLRPIQMHAAS